MSAYPTALVLNAKLTVPEAPAGSTAVRSNGSENCGMGFGLTAPAARLMSPLNCEITNVPVAGVAV